jgi:energy-coupling factor transport system substrate-specific component
LSNALALRLATAGALAAAGASAAWTALAPGQAGLALLVLAAALVAAGVAWFESSVASAKEIALLSTLAGAAAVGRVVLHPLPGVQPMTVMVVAAGAALGPRAGLVVGGLGAFVSNFFLGQGPWTPWQVLAWGACGAAGGLLAPLLRRRLPFALACLVLAFLYSVLLDAWEWFSFYPHTPQALAVVYGRGIWFELAHAVASFAFALAAGPELRRLLERYARRLRTEVVWDP